MEPTTASEDPQALVETIRLFRGSERLQLECVVDMGTYFSVPPHTDLVSLTLNPKSKLVTLPRIVAFAMVVVSCVAIFSTARVFSGTVDEPARISQRECSGSRQVSTHTTCSIHRSGRIATAIGPYVSGFADDRSTSLLLRMDAAILGSGAHYVDKLAYARHGVLPFFLLLAFVVWMWARRTLGEAGAAVAVALVVCNPNVVAHAGLATTSTSRAPRRIHLSQSSRHCGGSRVLRGFGHCCLALRSPERSEADCPRSRSSARRSLRAGCARCDRTKLESRGINEVLPPQ